MWSSFECSFLWVSGCDVVTWWLVVLVSIDVLLCGCERNAVCWVLCGMQKLCDVSVAGCMES